MENVSLKELLIFYKKKIMLLIMLFLVILGVSILTLKILDNKNYQTKVTLISYKEVNDIEIMREKGYLSVPVLEVDGTSMDFKQSVDWVNSLN